MISLVMSAVGAVALLGVTDIAGTVVDDRGRPVAGARVFLEPGLTGALSERRADEGGAFLFEDVAPGAVGVFAFTEGFAFGGRHVNIAVADALSPLTIVLPPAEQVSGRVADPKGKPVAGARITRIALKGEAKVGIPLAKLAAFGFAEPVSGADGRFTIGHVPQGGAIDIKAAHPDYAQEAAANAPAGAADIKIEMHPGVLLQGEVRSRTEETAVARAVVIVRNAQPPHDSAALQSDGLGQFLVRLKPGVYMLEASGAGLRSPGGQRLTITGEQPSQRVVVHVAGTGVLRGEVRDAASGGPIAGARLDIFTSGNLAEITRTGATGEYRVVVAAGEHVVKLGAAPGYAPPEGGATKVMVAAGQDVLLPGLWLAPIPAYNLQVLQPDLTEPAPGALVSLLRPYQLGWRSADEEGTVEIRVGNLPADGRLVGKVEHPSEALGAVFALDRSAAAGAQVQLWPLSSVSGRVVDERGRGVEGAVIGGVFPGENFEEALLLWRTVSGADGTFWWPAVAPGVPQQCAVQAGGAAGESAPFNLEPNSSKALGDIPVNAPAAGKSLRGKPLKWRESRQTGGAPLARQQQDGRAVVVYAQADEAPVAIEALAACRRMPGAEGCQFAVVVSGAYAPGDSPIPVFAGVPPGTATTYVMDAGGRVVLETFGLPPLRALREASAR